MSVPAAAAEWLVTAGDPPGAPAPPADVATLTRAVAAGDAGALAALYRDWFDAMYREARRACGRDEAFCLDVVQDALLRVIRSLPPLRTRRELWGFLRTVVRCCACDRLREESRRRRREQAREPREPSGQDGPEAIAVIEERLARVRLRLERLDDRHAQLLVMRYRFGWTLQRIARSVGLEPGAVDGRLRRIAARLGAGGRDHG